jgi:hypothetical protein
MPRLERYDELLTLSRTDTARLQRITQAQDRVILALDGLQPEVGHAVLWDRRDCLAGEVLLARRVLSAPQPDLAVLRRTVRPNLPGPMVGIIADGQLSSRGAVAAVLPDVPPQVCHLHSLREAAQPIYDADRHAKQALKKRVRGVRPIERHRAGRSDPEAAVVRGSCAAVRRALTEDGRPPLDASGLTLHAPLTTMTARLERVEKRGPCPRHYGGCRACWRGA